MSGFNIQYIIEAADKFSPSLNRFNDKIDTVRKKMAALSEKFVNAGKNMTLKVTAPLALIGGLAVRSAGKLESLETAFVGILGSAEKAKKMVSELNDFTAKTPFQLDQVAKSAKGLLAAGVAPEKIKDQLQILGDVASAANAPLTDMSQIFAKIKNKGKAMTEEILQLSDRGIPIIDILSKQMGVAKSKVFEMASQSKISIDVMNKAFKKMTSEGGFANKAMILQSKTLNGVMSTAKDNIGLAAAEIGQIMLPTVKAITLAVIDAAQAFKSFVKNNPALGKIAVIIGVLLAAMGPFLIVLGKMASGFNVLYKAVAVTRSVLIAFGNSAVAMKFKSIAMIGITKLWAAAQWLLNAAMAANPIVLIIGGIIAATAAVIGLIVYWKEFLGLLKQAKEWLSESWAGQAVKWVGGQLDSNEGMPSGMALSNQDSSKNIFSGDIGISLNDPGNSVKSTSVKAGDGLNLNLGTNMAGAM